MAGVVLSKASASTAEASFILASFLRESSCRVCEKYFLFFAILVRKL
jgi:hypothetical protein